MSEAFQILFAIAAVAVFVWLLMPEKNPSPETHDSSGEPFIDPNDSYQIGMLAGLTGHSIPDAAVMRFALQRFQQIHGRRATSRDIGIVLGLINSQD
jgi:hypothetical protein